MTKEVRHALKNTPVVMSPDEAAAAARGLTYFNDTNPKHLQRVTRLWWRAVESATLAECPHVRQGSCVSCQRESSPGTVEFEKALRALFMRLVEAEFVVWQSWPAEWAGFLVWRVLGGGTPDSEWDEVIWPDEWAAGHEISKDDVR